MTAKVLSYLNEEGNRTS